MPVAAPRAKLVAAFLACAGLLACLPNPARGDVLAMADISASNFQFSAPSGATIEFLDGWSSAASARAQNSLGEFDNQSSSNMGSASSASAAVTYASASGNADVSPLSSSASSAVHIPGAIGAEAMSKGTGSLSNTLEITGGSGAVNVTLSADLSGEQKMQTDQYGIQALTEVIFNLQVDGNPTLFYDSPLSIGSSAFADRPFSTTLSTTISLNFRHSLRSGY